MGDIKYCAYCGSSIPFEAAFCPYCGKKQETLARASDTATSPEIPQNVNNQETTVQDTVHEASETGVTEKFHQEPAEITDQKEPVSADNDPAAPDQQKQIPEGQEHDPMFITQAPDQQQHQQFLQQIPTSPVSGPQQAQPAAQKPRKRFPWVFAILWAGMLVFVCVWVYLWFTYPNPEINNPLYNLTADTFRILAPVVTIILMIYTLNLKIVVKKLKVIPTIILILTLLFSVFMFLSFELVEGDWAHDLIRPVTELFFEFE